MKKKGLIISTVVMVVVLIAALTTATFAWFTNSAAAQVGAIDLTTEAADGLQIAVVSANSDTVYTVSGEVTRDRDGYIYKNGNAGFGNTVTFSTSDDSAISMFGVSGDGKNMLTAGSGASDDTANTGAYIKNGKPVYMVGAQANKYYFSADLAIEITSKITESKKVELIFKSLSVQGTGSNANSGYMAAAARIAFIPIKPDGTADAATGSKTAYSSKADLDMTKALYFHPYYDFSYVGNTFQKASAAPENPAKSYNNTSKGSEYSAVSTAQLGGKHYVGSAATTAAQITDWTENKLNGAANFKSEVLGSYTETQQVLYIRVVIWFEGEDAECIQGSTGSGLTVSFEFDKSEEKEID